MNEEVQKFIGLRIKTIKKLVTYGGRSREVVEYDSADENIVALRNICEGLGRKMRVWLPNTFGSMDFDMNRLNVRISSEDGITYVISSIEMG